MQIHPGKRKPRQLQFDAIKAKRAEAEVSKETDPEFIKTEKYGKYENQYSCLQASIFIYIKLG